MSSIRFTGLRSGAFLCAVTGALFAFGPLLSMAGATPTISGAASEPTNWLEEMDAYFEANPELKTKSGSGFKPFSRYKWAYETRLVDGQPPEPGARVKAWERKRQVEAALPAPRNTWFSLGPTNFGGRMLAVDFDPNDVNTIYAGAADGGAWKTTDGGNNWFPLTDEMPVLAVGGLAVSKTNPNVVVIGTGEGTFQGVAVVSGIGIWRSTDAGATWGPTSMVVPGTGGFFPFGHGFHFVECGPNGTFLAGATDGMYRSTDDGANWVLIKSGGDWYDAQWKPGDANRVYSVRGNATTASVKTSTDDGLTWSKSGTGQPLGALFGKSKLGLSGTTIYCLIAAPGTSGSIFDLLKSTDDGNNWTSMGIPSALAGEGQSWYNLICAADPNNANFVLCGGQQLGRSSTGGASFTNVLGGMHVDHHAVKYEPGSNTNVWMANDGGMWRSTSDGSFGSWVSKNNGLTTYQFYDICVNNGPTAYYVMGGTQDNGTDKWSGTTTWANGLGGDGMVCNIAPTNGTTVYAETFNNQYRSLSSGGSGSFGLINGGLSGGSLWVTPVSVSWFNSNHLLTESTSGIFRSLNGTSWSLVAPHRAVWIDHSQVNGNYAWTAWNTTGVYYTSDNGASWNLTNPIPLPVSGGIRKILAHPTQLGTAFVTFSGYNTNPHIKMTTDFGTTWTVVSGDFDTIGAQPINAIAVDPSNPNEWFIGTDVGVWHSGNGGANWLPWETGLPNAVVLDLEIADGPRKLVAGTHGRGAWEINLPSTGTDAFVSAPQPLNLMLDAPSPNPARGRTMLRYAAKSAASVSLRVYDVHGRLVSNLEDFASGDGVIRTTPWLTDDVPSGVYFAVLQAGADQTTRKITVLK